MTDGDPAPEADEAARAARSTITGIGPPSFVDAFNAKSSCRWGVLEQSVEVRAMDEFEEERRAEKEEGGGGRREGRQADVQALEGGGGEDATRG